MCTDTAEIANVSVSVRIWLSLPVSGTLAGTQRAEGGNRHGTKHPIVNARNPVGEIATPNREEAGLCEDRPWRRAWIQTQPHSRNLGRPRCRWQGRQLDEGARVRRRSR